MKAPSNGGKLGQRWRLRVPPVVRSVPHVGTMKVHFYIDPDSGLFYTRVPEVVDGALFCNEYLATLRVDVLEAVDSWMKNQAPEDKREWTRHIRILYQSVQKSPRDCTKPLQPVMQDQAPAWWTPGRHPGVLHFVRFERAIRPGATHPADARFDVREWAEDYEARLARWANNPVGTRPQRMLSTESHDGAYITLAWEEERWQALLRLDAQLSEFAKTLEHFMQRDGLEYRLATQTNFPPLLGIKAEEP